MKRVLLFLCIAIPCAAICQENGIRFERGLSWEQVKQKARIEKKYIFLDCYATWCGPCKWMNANIFLEKQVAEFYNDQFINVSVQMDRTTKDGEDVRNWYTDADNLSKEFKINAFPTYLFFSPDGTMVHRLIGAVDNAHQFLAAGKNATEPTQQYKTIIEDYKNHSTDSIYLLNAVKVAYRAGDKKNSALIFDQYLTSLKNPVTAGNAMMIVRNGFLTGTKDKAFSFFIRHATEIDMLVKSPSFVESAVSEAIYKEKMVRLFELEIGQLKWKPFVKNLKLDYPTLGNSLIDAEANLFGYSIYDELAAEIKNKQPSEIDWNKTQKKFRKKFPDFDFEIWFWMGKASYFKALKNEKQMAEAIYQKMKIIQKDPERFRRLFSLNPREVMNNEICTGIFPYCSDKKILSDITKISKSILDKYPGDPDYSDTYANLLYKTGKYDEAVKLETQALNTVVAAHASTRTINEFKEALDKMTNNKPTWSDETPVRQ